MKSLVIRNAAREEIGYFKNLDLSTEDLERYVLKTYGPGVYKASWKDSKIEADPKTGKRERVLYPRNMTIRSEGALVGTVTPREGMQPHDEMGFREKILTALLDLKMSINDVKEHVILVGDELEDFKDSFADGTEDGDAPENIPEKSGMEKVLGIVQSPKYAPLFGAILGATTEADVSKALAENQGLLQQGILEAVQTLTPDAAS